MSQSLVGVRRDQTTLLVWQRRGSRLSTKPAVRCVRREIFVFYTVVSEDNALIFTLSSFNQSKDALWPARPMGLAAQLAKCQKPNWERLCRSLNFILQMRHWSR